MEVRTMIALHLPRLVPLSLCLLLTACGASAEADAQIPPPGNTAIDAPAPRYRDADTDDLDVHDAQDDQDDDLAVDGNGEYDPAAEIRRQLARRPAPSGSGGPVQACMLTGTIKVLAHSEDVRDCMQSDGKYSVAEFQRACEGLANALVGGGNAPARIDYMPRCPTPAQGSCDNALGTGMKGYYYQRPADNLAALPASCTSSGGNWRSGG
jgi:hypothetical protein